MSNLPQRLHVRVRLEDGSLWATVDEFPGVLATGESIEELRASLQEGVAMILASPGEPTPAVHLGELHPEPLETTAELTYA